MEIKERKNLRMKLLKELYDNHFNPNAEEEYLLEDPDKPESVLSDYEVMHAYEFLKFKKYIIFHKDFNSKKYNAEITMLGIDYFEETYNPAENYNTVRRDMTPFLKENIKDI